MWYEQKKGKLSRDFDIKFLSKKKYIKIVLLSLWEGHYFC